MEEGLAPHPWACGGAVLSGPEPVGCMKSLVWCWAGALVLPLCLVPTGPETNNLGPLPQVPSVSVCLSLFLSLSLSICLFLHLSDLLVSLYLWLAGSLSFSF